MSMVSSVREYVRNFPNVPHSWHPEITIVRAINRFPYGDFGPHADYICSYVLTKSRNLVALIFTQPIHRMAGSVLGPVCESVSLCVSHTSCNALASLEEDKEKEIYCSSRGEGPVHLGPVRGSIP